MADFESMKRDLLAECEDDHVSRASVIGYVEDELGEANETELQKATLDLLYELLKAGRVQAGFPDANGRELHPWPFAVSAIIDKIRSLWDPNGARPKPGEVVWFTTPWKSPARAS